MAHDDQMAMQFLVREASARGASQGGATTSSPPTHGLGGRVQVRPMGWEVVFALDGLPSQPLPKGSVLDVRVEPERGMWVRTMEMASGQ